MGYKHLSIRVPWHDNGWSASVCKHPSLNNCCTMLPRIYAEKQEKIEDLNADKSFNDITVLPPCIAESGAFLNGVEWLREFRHPYNGISDKHKCLLPTTIKIPKYSTFAVPFWWMLKSNQVMIEEFSPDPLPQEEEAPFPTSWIFGSHRQVALLNLFFGKLKEKQSLVFFYTKNGNEVDETASRLIVGVGKIVKVNDIQYYESNNKTTYPFWDRLINHSIRPINEEEAVDGILLPYHKYLELAGDDPSILEKLEEIKISIDDESLINQFSYGSELVGHEAAIYVLQKLFASVSAIIDHGLVKGEWEKRREWINECMAQVWRARGAFPGFGSALEAMGIRYGTSLAFDLVSMGVLKDNDNPWPVIEKIFSGELKSPKKMYDPDIVAAKKIWAIIPKEKKTLLVLLSRFDLTPDQAKRWFQPLERSKYGINVTEEEIIRNPYIIAELDTADGIEPIISLKTIDNGMMPDPTISAKHPVPYPSKIESNSDHRRIRAILSIILKDSAYGNGDTLLSIEESIDKLDVFSNNHPCTILVEWFDINKEYLNERINIIDFENGRALQLKEFTKTESLLEKILKARAMRELPKLQVDWEQRLIDTIEETNGIKFDSSNKRFNDALSDQVEALETITSRKISVLIGPAGTGKTSVMGALLRCNELTRNGVLLLAPTGKARVKLGRMANAEAYTVAQFLNKQGRYDWNKCKPKLFGESKYMAERTVVVDECSMLTVEDLFALLESLDLNHVTRIILVGDPNQLPPIGPGRPFADLCKYLDTNEEETKSDPNRYAASKSLAKLKVIVRQANNAQESDSLKLASWFSGEAVEPNDDCIFDKLSTPELLNDLGVKLWNTPDDLYEKLLEAMKCELNLKSIDDIEGFNIALGLEKYEKGWIFPYSNPNGAENFQIISPVNNPPWGNFKLNRFIQERYRGNKLKAARAKKGTCLGDQQIVVHDKIIQNINMQRRGYDHLKGIIEKYAIANGEIGVVCPSGEKSNLNIAFGGRPNLTFGYWKKEFDEGGGPLDLAYAISVHKAQGSDYKIVFMILPKICPIQSRELIYTALTRSKTKMILLIQGDNPSWIFDLSNGKYSETARRNSNLFFKSIRRTSGGIPYAEHLIHTTEKEGLLVRSKSEVIIANMLFRENISFEYEREFHGEYAVGTRRPDFSFIDPAGDLIIWEHLGLLHRESYRRSWEEKKKFYELNGYKEGVNLFTTSDSENGTINIKSIKETIENIKSLI